MRVPNFATLRILGLVAIVGWATPCLATPEDVYSRGREAYFRDDLIDAMRLLRKSADEGYTPAKTLLAYILDQAEENAAALQLFRDAAHEGDTEAMFGLAKMLAAGDGVVRDVETARRWYETAANQGHGHASVILAEAYLAGGLGLARDRNQAISLLKRGAAAGYVPARERLQRLGE